ncbi:MAG: gliding motility-associated C-terminal domain-containing protein, partial [Raineya sp.]|nr:gliding motility-associated C-terminal domain-containing protein [Raineya sp.]
GSLQYFFYDEQAVHKRYHQEHPEDINPDAEIRFHSFVVKFLGASPVQAKPTDLQPTLYNYYLGNDRQFWADECKSYKKVHFEGIYPNISYHLFSRGSSLKYEFHLEVGANPRHIQMQYEYASGLEILPDGTLEIKTTLGSIYEKKPYSYQVIKGKEVEVPTRFVLNGNVVSFDFPQGYNKKYPLIIDPGIVFATYSGATSSVYGNTACFDEAGHLYAGGTSFGPGMRAGSPTPTNEGSLGGSVNIRLYKYNPTGTTLLYVTFVGGNDNEIPHSLVVDSNNFLYAFGSTGSSNFPSDVGTFQGGTGVGSIFAGISYSQGTDMYIVKLNPNGTRNRIRILGGSGNEAIKPSSLAWTINNYGDVCRGDIYADINNDILVATNTTSNTIAGVTGSLQGGQDALLLKFDDNLNLIFGRYFGGNNLDLALSVKTNALGEIYLGGATRSTNLPNATGLNTTAFGNDDGFIAKFDNNGNLIRSTYLGTAQPDMVFFIDLDVSGNVYAYGQSRGGTYPIAPASVYNNGNSGQFIHKLNGDLTVSEWSTRVGNGNGTYNLSPTAFLVDICGNIYIAGYGGWSGIPSVTGSPVTPDAFKSTTDGTDFYLAVYRPNMTGLLYATFVGGASSNEHVDGGTSRFAKDGTVYHAVCTNAGFLTTPGVWQPTIGSGATWDCAVFKFQTNINADFTMQDPTSNTTIVGGGTSCSAVVNFRFPQDVTEFDSFQWTIYDVGGNILFTTSTQQNFSYTFTSSGNYKIRLVVSNCNKTAQKIQDLIVAIPNFQAPNDATICRFSSVQLVASGAKTYRWTPATGLSNPNIPNPIASPLQTTTYTLEMKDDNCTVRKQVKVTVLPAEPVNFDFQLLKDCNTPYRVKLNLVNVDTLKFKEFRWSMGEGTTYTGTTPPEHPYLISDREYTITLVGVNLNDCETRAEKKVYVPKPPIFPPNLITPNGDGVNDVFEVAEAGSKIKIYNRWGKLIYQSDNYHKEWGNGKEVMSGTYYYHLESPSGVNCSGWLQVMK